MLGHEMWAGRPPAAAGFDVWAVWQGGCSGLVAAKGRLPTHRPAAGHSAAAGGCRHSAGVAGYTGEAGD